MGRVVAAIEAASTGAYAPRARLLPRGDESPSWSGRRSKFKYSFDRLVYLLDRVQYELPNSAQAASMAIGHLYGLECYLRKNEASLISYRDWRQAGRRISTSGSKGTVNGLIGGRMCKFKHM